MVKDRKESGSRLFRLWGKHKKPGESFGEFRNRIVKEAVDALEGNNPEEQEFKEGDKFFVVTKAESTRYPTQAMAEEKAAEFIDKHEHEFYFVMEAKTLVKKKPIPVDNLELKPVTKKRLAAIKAKKVVEEVDEEEAEEEEEQ